MARFLSASIALGAASGCIVADAFRSPHAPPAVIREGASRARRVRARPTSPRGTSTLLMSQIDGEADLVEETSDVEKEIEEALALARDALAAPADAVPDEDEEDIDIDEIASMLLEKPPIAPPPLPLPPKEDPPASLVTLTLEEGVDAYGEVEEAAPAPPETAPDLGEMLQKKAAEEIEKMKNSMFGLKDELKEVEASAEEAEDAVSVLKKEIEESLTKREALIEQIESEAAAEKKLLVAQMETASNELKAVMDQSAQNVTDAKASAGDGEKELISRIESFKASIDKMKAEIMEIKTDKERIQEARQSKLDKVVEEGKAKLARFQQSFQFDMDYARQVNADLSQRAEEAEGKVRSVYEEINRMRTERVSLQQQIADVEKNALEEIATLERELALDDERYAAALEEERERMATVIDAAYQAYAIRVCKKIVEREAVEADYDEKLSKISAQVAAAKEKQAARVKACLDEWEEDRKKERISLYQERFEAVSAVRKQMNAELAVENAKIEETHSEMRAKIDAVQEQTAEVKAEFEREIAKKRQLAKDEEEALLRQIEDVRVDMTDKIKTQRRLYDEKKSAYLEDMNGQISESETELRQRWRDLAVVKKSYSEVSAKRDHMIDDVAEQHALIDSYESDQKSFRKSLRLTARIAKQKLGAKLKRDKKEAP